MMYRFAFKMKDGSEMTGNKSANVPHESTRGTYKGNGKERTAREIYKDPNFQRLRGKMDKGRKVDGAMVTKRQRRRQGRRGTKSGCLWG